MRLKLSSPKIWLATSAVDFRKSVDGLLEIIHSQFLLNAKDSIFIFYNQHRNKLKILAWHGNGFIIIYKRLEQGRFTTYQSEEGLLAVDEKQLSWLLAGLDWVSLSQWKELEFNDCY
jgi:transposase